MSTVLNRPLFRQGGGGAELPRVVDAPQLPWGEVGNRTLDATVRAPVEFYRNMFTGGDEQPATQRILEGYPEIDEQARIEATLEGLLPSQKEFVTDLLARGMSLDYAIHQLRTKIIFERHRIENEESRAGLLPDPPPYVPPTEAEMLERVGPQARAMMEHEGYSADVAVPSVRRSIRAFDEERPYSVPEAPSEGLLRQPRRFNEGKGVESEGQVEQANRYVRGWDFLTNGEEKRRRAQLNIYEAFSPEQKLLVERLINAGAPREDAIFQVWSEARRQSYKAGQIEGPAEGLGFPTGETQGFMEPSEPMMPIQEPMEPMPIQEPMMPTYQQGGPVMPPQAMMAPPPQAMMAPPPQQGAGLDALMAQAPQALGAAEEQTAAEMEKVGSQYVNEMMSAVDMAESPEDLMNAIRGTNVPIEDRYMELAQIVGPDDAQSTPESVLVLVQPTLMMTEQGALDSGVGNLMQEMVSSTEMATDTGVATPMGEGVGNLMMAGAAPPDMMMAGAPPPDMMMAGAALPPDMMARRGGPVQNFWGGGPVVQKFADGNGVTALGSIGTTYGQTLPLVEGILGSDPDYLRNMALLSGSKHFFNWGAGRGPRGENIANRSTVSQLASNLGGFAGDLGTLATTKRKEGQAAKLAALNLAGTLAGQDVYDYEVVGDRLIRVHKISGDTKDITGEDKGGTYFGKSYKGYLSAYLTDPGLRRRYAEGKTTDREDAALHQIFTDVTSGYIEEGTGRRIPGGELSPDWSKAIDDRTELEKRGVSGFISPRKGKATAVGGITDAEADDLRKRLFPEW